MDELSTKSVVLHKEDKNPDGGLTQKGRDKLNKETGSDLKAPVNKKPSTPEEYRRQGQFLTRFYGKKSIPPLVKPNGEPTRYALAAKVWNSPVPKTVADVKKLYAKGKGLLKHYADTQKHSMGVERSEEGTNIDQVGPDLTYDNSQGMLCIPLAILGDFQHPSYDEVNFTTQDYQDIITNFQLNVLGFEPYVTYGHLDDDIGSTDADLKKGNLIKLEVQGDILWGHFTSDPDTWQLVKTGEYEYASGEFIRGFQDKRSGEDRGTVLMRVALTNAPFIPFDGQKVQAYSTSITPSTIDKDVINTNIKVTNASDNAEVKLIPHNTISIVDNMNNIKLSLTASNGKTIDLKLSNLMDKDELVAAIQELIGQGLDFDALGNATSDCDPDNYSISDVYLKQGAAQTMSDGAGSAGVSSAATTGNATLPGEPDKEEDLSMADPAKEDMSTDPKKEDMSVDAKKEDMSTDPKKEDMSTSDAPINPPTFKPYDDQVLSLLAKFAQTYEEKMSAMSKGYEEKMSAMASKVDELSSKLGKQEEFSQAFSTSMSKKKSEARYAQLAEMGVSPNLIQKFSQIESSVKDRVVKLSNGAGEEKDVNVLDYLATLLAEAVESQPIEVQQFGQTVVKPSGIDADMRRLIELNKAKVAK